MRVIPTKKIEDNNPWEPFNPLFKKYINYIDEVCNKGGVRTDIRFYVEREDKFESNYVETLINRHEDYKFNKIEILTGKVGAGKSTFCDFIRKKLIPEEYPEIITFYIDITTLPSNDDEKYILNIIERRIFTTIEQDLINNIYGGIIFNYKKEYVESLGIPTFNEFDEPKILKTYYEDVEAIEERNKLKRLLKFLDFCLPKHGFKKVLLIIDNVDENKREIVASARYSVRELNSFFDENLTKLSSILLVPVRDYNTQLYCQYFQTKYNEPTDLRKVPEIAVAKSKFLELRHKISESTEGYKFNYDSPHTSQTSPELKTEISKENIIDFLTLFIDEIFANEDIAINKMLKELSAGNLKFLVANIFNILHSPFLPLNDLFIKKFYNSEHKRNNLFILPHLYSCLMAVHYPYYSSSHILNVFNADDSRQENDFQNVLIIIRILCFIQYQEEVQLKRIKFEFNNLGYHEDYIDAGLNKIYSFGLLDSDNGAMYKHLDDESRLSLSSSGINYLEHTFYKFTYLMFVSDKTPIDSDLSVDILEKYIAPKERNINIESKYNARRKSVKKFVEFIERNESLEKKMIEGNDINYGNFLNIFSLKLNKNGVLINEFIEEKISLNKYSQLNQSEKDSIPLSITEKNPVSNKG